MQIDRLTWGVLGVVVLILGAAVITVTMTEGRGLQTGTYLTEDTPATPVYNAFVAFQNGDVETARRQYAGRVFAETRASGFDPFTDRFAQRSVRRLRILDVQMVAGDANRAYVTVSLDTYSGSGLFGARTTWSRRLVFEVVREPVEPGRNDDLVWKINTTEFFY